MPIISLLGGNHCLPLFNMAKSFIWIEETKHCFNEILIGYMINPNLNIKSSFREKVDKCMNNTFGPITQPHIIAT